MTSRLEFPSNSGIFCELKPHSAAPCVTKLHRHVTIKETSRASVADQFSGLLPSGKQQAIALRVGRDILFFSVAKHPKKTARLAWALPALPGMAHFSSAI